MSENKLTIDYCNTAQSTTLHTPLLTPIASMRHMVIDIETTGLSSSHDDMIEIAWVVYEQGVEIEYGQSFLHTEKMLTHEIQQLTKITPSMLQNAPSFNEVIWKFEAILSTCKYALAYHVPFDKSFLERAYLRLERKPLWPVWLDPLIVVRQLDAGFGRHGLLHAAQRWNIPYAEQHRALGDARCVAQLWQKIVRYIPGETITDVEQRLSSWQSFQAMHRSKSAK